MVVKLRFLPPCTHLVIIILVTTWLNIQVSDSRDTYKRFKRWSTTLLAKPAEQHDCSDDGDCRNFPSTSCAHDKIDKKKKCLCPDYSQPTTSGDCKKLPKALRTPCQGDVECLQGAECIINEVYDPRAKLCYCREDYLEVNNTCTNGCGFPEAGPLAVAFSATFTFWTYTYL